MGFPDLNFSSLLNLVALAAKRDGIELSQEEIDKAVKKLAAAQDYLNEHGLQEDETAEGRFGSSPLGQTMSSQHRRVYGIMARSLDGVAKDLGQFATGIDTAAQSITTTDANSADTMLLQLLKLQAESSDLNNYSPRTGGRHHGGDTNGG
jgi:ABC-type nitrate/sulfonate/bicarbonate transport system substrate-binding protein